jgi:putative FmdB family regulatory protein
VPTYAYACTTCDHRFEAQQSFSDAALTECPQCQGRLRKLFNSVGIVFKGSGFYRTDSRSGAKPESSTADSGAKSDSSGSSTSSTSSSSSSSESSSSSSSGAAAGSGSGTGSGSGAAKSTPAASSGSAA